MRRNGYTMIEVMMALAILAVGAVGVISLQNVAVMSGLASRNLSTATNTASSWIERAQGEAAAWTRTDNSDVTVPAALARMPVLATALQPGNINKWNDLPASVMSGATALDGSATDGVAPNPKVGFCSQVRAVFLGPAGSADVVSFQVRTYFARGGRPLDAAECGAAAANMNTALASANGAFGSRFRDEYGFVFLSGTVRRNTQ
jgi:type IV pilus assembly protein PilV